MGLFTDKKPTLAEGLEKYGKGLQALADAQERATWEAEDARKQEAKMQKLAAKQEKEMKDRAENAERAAEYSGIAQEGTAEAYRKLFHAYFTEQSRQDDNYTANQTLKKSLTLQIADKGYDNVDKVKELLKGFPFDNDPVELHKIFVFLTREFKEHPDFALEQLNSLETAAEMNSHNQEIAAFLPEIRETIAKLREEKKQQDKKELKMILCIVGGCILIGLLALLFS